MKSFQLEEYVTSEELVEAHAQKTYRRNLESGGVFNADGTRHSDIEVERIAARHRLRFSPRHGAYVIEGTGKSKRPLAV